MSRPSKRTTGIELSVVIPIRNKEAFLTGLFERLYPELDGLGLAYEVIFVDDGSRDRSCTLLRQQYKLRPDVTHLLFLCGALDRHAALAVGFDASAGRRLVFLDPDQPSAPGEIPRLISEMDRGCDYVGSVRRGSRQAKWGDAIIAALGRLRDRLTGIQMTDPASMPIACERKILEAAFSSGNETPSSLPALACLCAATATEVELEPGERVGALRANASYRRIRCELELIMGLSLVPLQLVAAASMGLSLVCLVVSFLLIGAVLLADPQMSVTLAVSAALFFLSGVLLFATSALGWYLGNCLERSRGGRASRPIKEQLRPRGPARSNS